MYTAHAVTHQGYGDLEIVIMDDDTDHETIPLDLTRDELDDYPAELDYRYDDALRTGGYVRISDWEPCPYGATCDVETA